MNIICPRAAMPLAYPFGRAHSAGCKVLVLIA